MKHVYLLLLLLGMRLPTLSQAYWQQEVNYTIAVTLNDRDHSLQGQEEILYTNNSPDALPFLYFHLWPNAYQHKNTAFARQQLENKKRDFQFAPDSSRGYIDGLDFQVNGQPVKVEYDAQHPDICKLVLPQALQPGQQLRITTPFHVKLPASYSRLGHVGQSYQITQWYPKPAVYDRKGWHVLPYLDLGEFYSDFGRYDVRITLPANYTVGATGVLQNPAEQRRLDSLAALTAARKDFPKQNDPFPPSASATKTLRYVQDRVHDFAWFADKRFHVLKSEVSLPHSKRKVATWLLFLNKDAAAWLKSLEVINEAIYYYSLYNGDYPYAQATAVDGALSAGAGMEYPMVTVTDPKALLHEVGHNWFYGILASQERLHPWMDEGLNSYYEYRIAGRKDPNYSQMDFLVKNPGIARRFGLENIHSSALNLLLYQAAASRGLDQPATAPAADFTMANYGSVVYMKTGVLFHYLANYLSQARFDSCMQAYYQRWQFRHPYPEDLQQVFEEVSGEKLDWFFRGLLPGTEPMDGALTDFRRQEATLQVQVSQRGRLQGPVPVVSRDAAGKILEVRWTKPQPEVQELSFSAAGVADLVLDPGYFLPELNRRNNRLQVHKALAKTEPLRLQLLGGVEQFDRRQLYFLPVLGANTYDKTMLGIALYNSSIVRKKVNYLLMPFYSTGRQALRGSAQLAWSLQPRQGPRLITLQLQAQRYERYTKLEPSLQLDLGKIKSGAWEKALTAGYTAIREEEKIFQEGRYQAGRDHYEYGVAWLRYRLGRQNALRGLSAEAQLERLPNSTFSSKLSLGYQRYYAPQDRFRARLFAGRIWSQDSGKPGWYALGLSGSPDYRKESIFLDRSQRSDGLTAFQHQTDGRDGGFRGYVPVYSTRWLAALNLDADLPLVPLGAYLDLGLTGNFYYGSGFSLSLLKDYFEIYLPLAGSNYAQDIPQDFQDFKNNIRFQLRLQALSPFRLLQDVLR
ncbi:MAG: M1 family metallopeptidase [Adhaeribacter sp.]